MDSKPYPFMRAEVIIGGTVYTTIDTPPNIGPWIARIINENIRPGIDIRTRVY